MDTGLRVSLEQSLRAAPSSPHFTHPSPRHVALAGGLGWASPHRAPQAPPTPRHRHAVPSRTQTLKSQINDILSFKMVSIYCGIFSSCFSRDLNHLCAGWLSSWPSVPSPFHRGGLWLPQDSHSCTLGQHSPNGLITIYTVTLIHHNLANIK